MNAPLEPVEPDPEAEGLWVRSWRMNGNKGYGVRVNVGARSWNLVPREALEYAAGFVAAATTAEHDTAVFRLLTERVGIEPRQVAELIGRDLRPDRVDRSAATDPIELRPAVGQHGPFVGMWLDGQQVGELRPADAREHALAVLDTLAAADLDASLRRMLVGPLGLDEARASAVIRSLEDVWPPAEAPRSRLGGP